MIKAIEKLPSIGKNKEVIAETIEGNIRRLLIDKKDVNPIYYDKISKILKELIAKRRQEVISYEEYLKAIERLTRKIIRHETIDDESYPVSISHSVAKKAIYDNLEGFNNREKLTNKIDEAIKKTKKDNWRGNRIKERQVKNAIKKILQDDKITERIFNIVLNQSEY